MMYSALEDIMYLNKIEKGKRLDYLNKIDAKLNAQKICMDRHKQIQYCYGKNI